MFYFLKSKKLTSFILGFLISAESLNLAGIDFLQFVLKHVNTFMKNMETIESLRRFWKSLAVGKILIFMFISERGLGGRMV